ncbi:Glu/Leu/Phe/Val dehydrogenase dimerization domain-containing protein [uncultured Agrococcus sp.]|uniref:Glu/Leu/Phe/Val dehydrogenase dimerization domain-containing protein n=1 Tax=uncultured Agrococcus sp. TaxID=382258 RepID=UPI0025D4F02D|nr:Glu/Leu/Phe/Val dehydrogenase dimerization domain-containing protein [uncultured Agrococcus sp.]
MPTAVADRPAFLEVTWHDDHTDAVGYVVIDRLLRGVASGGLRMRKGCTLEEVRGLADAMTKKEAIHLSNELRYVPVGGAKGGIDFDSRSPDAPGVLERFLDSLGPILRTYWAAGEDLGVQQDVLDEIFERRGWGSMITPVRALLPDPEEADRRIAEAFEVVVDGVAQDELVGGLGVAVSALTALECSGRRAAETTAIVQGFGSMGGATARFLAEAGVRVVGIVDADGMVFDAEGLDVDAMLGARDRFGSIDRTQLADRVEQLPGDAWLATECDVLVPAAISGTITDENQGAVLADFVVEAANLPVTASAEASLAERGIRVVPDFVANSGTNAWWWWLLFGDVDGSWRESRALVEQRLGELTREIFTLADQQSTTLRSAAQQLSAERLAVLEDRERTLVS